MQDTSSSPTSDQDKALLARVWPEGVPPAEQALWFALDEDRRRLGRTRLRALLSYEQEGNWARRAQEAELSRPRFFSMLRAWRAHRSLRSIVPDAAGRKGRGVGGSASDAIREAITRLMQDEPTLSNEKLVNLIRAEIEQAPSATTLRHLVASERARARHAGLGRDAGLGQFIALDTSPVFLRRPRTEAPLGAMLGMAIDQATGLILGYAVGYDRLSVIGAAAADASERVRDLPVDMVGGDAPRFEVALGGDAVATLREVSRLAGLPDTIEVVTERRDRPLGKRLLEAFGPAIGKLDLKLRAKMPDRPEEGKVLEGGMTASEVIAGLPEDQIAEHNDAILKRGVRGSVPRDLLVAALARIAGKAERQL